MTRASMTRDDSARMCEVALAALDDAKGAQTSLLDVRALTDITDYMIISTGSSKRHVKTLSERVLEKMRAAGWAQLGVEGDEDWLLVDFVDVVVHIMRAPARELYNLEGLWDANLAPAVAAEDA